MLFSKFIYTLFTVSFYISNVITKPFPNPKSNKLDVKVEFKNNTSGKNINKDESF